MRMLKLFGAIVVLIIIGGVFYLIYDNFIPKAEEPQSKNVVVYENKNSNDDEIKNLKLNVKCGILSKFSVTFLKDGQGYLCSDYLESRDGTNSEVVSFATGGDTLDDIKRYNELFLPLYMEKYVVNKYNKKIEDYRIDGTKSGDELINEILGKTLELEKLTDTNFIFVDKLEVYGTKDQSGAAIFLNTNCDNIVFEMLQGFESQNYRIHNADYLEFYDLYDKKEYTKFLNKGQKKVKDLNSAYKKDYSLEEIIRDGQITGVSN